MKSESLTISFQGVEGAYSQLAAIKYFGPGIETEPTTTFRDVFKSIAKGRVDYAIVPVENSLAGSIHENYDHLLHHRVWVCGEVKVKIRHNLIGPKGSSLKSLRKIYSHPQALAQCQGFIRSLKRVEPVPFFDTAGSAKMVGEKNDKSIGAIAGDQVTNTYPVKVLKTGIEDDPLNFTRFLVLQKRYVAVDLEKKCKTSIVFALKNIPGALHKALSIFSIREVDLFKIESRPIPGSPWKYLFYLDFKGNYQAQTIKNCLRHLKEISEYLRVLGSYEIWRGKN